MPYDSPYVVLCRILPLLRAFLVGTDAARDAWMKIEPTLDPIVPYQNALAFGHFTQQYTDFAEDLIHCIDTPTTPSEVKWVVVRRVNQILRDGTTTLATNKIVLMNRPDRRRELFHEMLVLSQNIIDTCHRIERRIDERDYKMQACSASLHRRLSRGASIGRLPSDIIMRIAQTSYDISSYEIAPLLEQMRRFM
jgi:hypothetical protein